MLKNVMLGAVLPLLLVATGVGVLIGMKGQDPSKKQPVLDQRPALLGQMPAADVEQVRALAEMSETLDIPVSGTVVPYRELQVAAEAAGRIIEKNPQARSGNIVRKGDVLYRIDPRDYELDVQRLTRRRDQEKASIIELSQEIENSKRLLQVVDDEVALAQSDVKRIESIQGGFRSQAELDQAKRILLSSMNQRVVLQNQISQLQTRSSRLELAAQLAETELEQAELNLERTVIRAPVTGRIVSEQVEADSYVQRGTMLVLIEDTEKVEVAVNLRMDQLYWILDQQSVSADRLVNAVQAAQYVLPRLPAKVRYQVAGRESVVYEWEGTLDRYDGAGLDPQSRTVPIRILVDGPGQYKVNGRPSRESSRSGPPTLVRGMFVEVVVQARPATQLLLVPKLSVKPATGTNQIWKFTADERALEVMREKLRRAGSLATPEQAAAMLAAPNTTDLPDSENQERGLADAELWQEGFLTVLDGVEVIGPFKSNATLPGAAESSPKNEEVEYWVCEVTAATLQPGDWVVVTPLPGIEAAGDEVLRVRKDRMQ